ncbi:transposase family protein [Mycobacterium simulans]|uniref:transposase family protein n=1 Tax=Mycobacterium simulans TaxID=627089 RepID=UPI0021B1BF40|nr:transposase family protein [Mycobacterium simulans]
MGVSVKLEALGLLKSECCEAFRRTKGNQGPCSTLRHCCLGCQVCGVECVERLPDGTRVVHAVTAEPTAPACPSCEVLSTSVKGRVTTSPRDIPYSEKRIIPRCNKTRWRCWCGRAAWWRSITRTRPSHSSSTGSIPPRRRAICRCVK